MRRCLAIACLLCATPSAGHALWPKLSPTDPPPAGDEATYYVRALGEVDPAQTRFACVAIQREFGLRCRVLRARPVPAEAMEPARFQYRADVLVDVLFRELPSDAMGLMAVTNADLYEASAGQFVFGLASRIDHVGVVSLARYRASWWGELRNTRRFWERYDKVLVHEVGHTLGLAHCDDQRCVMRDDRTLEGLDASPRHFCRRCKEGLKVGRSRRPGTAEWHYIRGHSHLNRGQHAQAVYQFQHAVELRGDSAQFHNDLGVAYLRRGDKARALMEFRTAQALEPRMPNALYNEGLLFLSVGDLQMARRGFEAALTADPSWALAHRQLGELYQKAFQDQDSALAHFEAYLAAHGKDESIESEVRMIKGGGRLQPGQ